MSNGYGWLLILQEWWEEEEEEQENFEVEEGENMNMKWLRIKDEWVPVNRIKKIMIENGILCYRVILEAQSQYILSTFKKHEEAEEYVKELLKAIIQQDIIETETIQIT